MKATLESLLQRVKKEVAVKEKGSELKKQAAKLERARRAIPQTIYEREELWFAVKLHREYEIQICDCCKGEQVHLFRDRIELRHKIDKSAIRWRTDRGEGMEDLKIGVTVTERVIPECWDCYSLGKHLQHLFKKGTGNERQERNGTVQQVQETQAHQDSALAEGGTVAVQTGGATVPQGDSSSTG